MEYNLEVENKQDFLWVTATGKERNLEIILAMAKDVLAACSEHKVKLVLLDIRPLEGLLKTTESFDISDKYLPQMRDRSVITRVVIVDREECRENDRFFENVAFNRGFNLRIFQDSDKAKEWLLS